MPIPDVTNHHVYTGHKDAIYTLCPAGEDHFFSSGGDGMVVKWDLRNDQPGELIARLPATVYTLQYLPQENHLIAGTRLGSIYIIDLNNKKQLNHLSLNGDVFSILALPAQDRLIAACGNGLLYFLRLSDLFIQETIKPTDSNARALALSGSTLATAWSDNKIRLYDAASAKVLKTIDAHDNSVFSLCYTPNGRYLLSGGRDAQLKIWDAAHDYSLLQSIPAHLYTINDIQWQERGQHFFTASRDKSIKIWDGRTLELLKVIDRTKYEAHTHSVNKLLWSPKHYLLISAGDDRRLCAWKVSFMSDAK